MSAFSSAWDLLKALSTEDLQQAARTGGIGMTPERRQAYTDAGLPLSTGGGFRTMPETEAQRIMRYQRTGSPEGVGFPIENTIGHDAKNNLADYLHQDTDTSGSLDMDDRLLDDYFKLTQGDSIDPMSDDEPPPQHPMKEYLSPIPRGRRDTIYDEHKTAFNNRARIKSYNKDQEEQNQRHLREYLNQVPDGTAFPPSEFARRGDAGASASDKAFSEMKRLRQKAEAHKQIVADRQKEMMMRQQQARMKSNQPPRGRAGGRRPGEGKNAYKNRMRRQGGRR
jgi:hypothetical protein